MGTFCIALAQVSASAAYIQKEVWGFVPVTVRSLVPEFDFPNFAVSPSTYFFILRWLQEGKIAHQDHLLGIPYPDLPTMHGETTPFCEECTKPLVEIWGRWDIPVLK